MSRHFYTDYVRHALRFYSRNTHRSQFNNDVDKANWCACNDILIKCDDQTKFILKYVYGNYDTLEDNVYEMSREYNINQNIIWDTMKEIENKIAKKRGLI